MAILRKIKDLMNNDRNNIKLLKKSDLFDEEYYLNENPNIKMSAVKHYYYYGYKEGKSPSYKFSNDFYLNTHKDVQASGMNPLIHYLRYGKSENRKIQKDNGTSVEGLYYKFFNYYYSINIYLKENKNNILNLFFDHIDKNIEEYLNIIVYAINYCSKYNYKLRIVYGNSELDYLKKILNENDIKTSDIDFLYLKKDNYLFVSSNDKFICTSYKCVLGLLNSNILKNSIYYYIMENGKTLKEKYWISKASHNPNVICLSDKDVNLNKYTIDLEWKSDVISNEIYFQADDFLMLGIIWFNNALNQKIINNFKFNIIYNKRISFHFDQDVETKCENKFIVFDKDEIFKISSRNIENVNIMGYLRKEVSNIKIYNLDNYEILNGKHEYQIYIDDEYLNFIKEIKKIGE